MMRVSIPTKIRVLQPDDSVREINLEDYTRGVVGAALPADTPLEAYKAQAIAARTFGVVTQRHTDKKADVCTARHCQVWLESAVSQVVRAVDETRRMVLTYEDKPIHAFYFEHCDGHTRDARGILIEPAPYCRAVQCPCGFATLRGHGIGMCQRGAAVMARNGDSYEKILMHYFSGVALVEGIPVSRRLAPAPEPNPPSPTPTLSAPRRQARRQRPAVSAPQPISPDPASLPPVVPQTPVPASPEPSPEARAPVEPAVVKLPDALKTNVVVTPAREVAIPPDILKRLSRRHREEEASVTPETTAPPPDLPEDFMIMSPPPGSMPEMMPEAPESFPENAPASQASRETVEEVSGSSGLVVDYLPGARMLAGNLLERGIVLTVYDDKANVLVSVSGEAPQYGEGGFEMALPHAGEYRVEVRNEVLTIRVREETVLLSIAAS